MHHSASRPEEIAEAVAEYLAASELALISAQNLRQAWAQHLTGSTAAPSEERIAEVTAQRRASELALERARTGAGASARAASIEDSESTPDVPASPRRKRRRLRENRFLAGIGHPGQRVLRWTLVLTMTAAVLVATAAAISLVLEVASALHLIDEPVQLPAGIQFTLFAGGAGLAWAIRAALWHVDRALYGSKGIRPKSFPL